MDHSEKENFVFTISLNYLRNLKGDEDNAWGLMNAQQMVEHLSDSVAMANGHNPHQPHTSSEDLPKWKAFAMSEKDFRPNTPNALLPDTPANVRNTDIAHAIAELENELAAFRQLYENDNQLTQMNPFFGPLNYNEWVHLFAKHFRHHLRQFRLIA